MKFWLLAVMGVGPMALAEGAAVQPALSPLYPMIFMLVIIYFLMIRPQQKKAKEHAKFLGDLKKGDMVVTNGGIIGTVKLLSEKMITLEVDNNVCIKILRNQILENAASLKEPATTKG